MANVVYPKFRHACGAQTLETALGATGDYRVLLVDLAEYAYSAAHEFLSDVPSAAIVAVSASLGSPSWASAVFDTADFVFPGGSGAECEAVILYQHDGGADGARRLIAYLDSGVGGIPVTPNGEDIAVTVDAAGWFAL
jgi:hypothetical protein